MGILFEAGGDVVLEVPDFTEEEKFYWEWEILGMNIREHFMARFRGELERQGFKSSRDLAGLPARRWVKVAEFSVLIARHPGAVGLLFSCRWRIIRSDRCHLRAGLPVWHLIFAPRPVLWWWVPCSGRVMASVIARE